MLQQDARVWGPATERGRDQAICFYYSQSVECEKKYVKLLNIMLNLKLSHFKRLVNVSCISFVTKIMKLASKA